MGGFFDFGEEGQDGTNEMEEFHCCLASDLGSAGNVQVKVQVVVEVVDL